MMRPSRDCPLAACFQVARSRATGASVANDTSTMVPDFKLTVDGTDADPAMKASVIGIRVNDDMDKASHFQIHLSDVGNKYSKADTFKPGTQIEIQLGYQGTLTSLIKAEVATLEMVLTPDGPSRLVVAGMDKGHSFAKGTQTKTYKDVKDS